MNKKILIIEDNEDLAQLLEIHLQDVGYSVELSYNGKDGFDKARHLQFDLVILDVMLPDGSGLDVCKQLRGLQEFVPILMLTSRSSELDRVLGLEVGADDYLTKPFSIPELLARIKALFRRIDVYQAQENDQNDDQEQTISHHDLTINLEKHIVTIANKSIVLTAKEFDLLVFFARHPGRVFTRTQLLDKVWGYSHEGYEHTVNSHINRLRLKVEKNPREPQYILTVWGVGYKFNDLLDSTPC
ncbi:MAG: response regulator transcription factor [Gammaproteobacteria bacterium]|nr:response regulator transcription factor [Gammaproteobacteria bacterium]